MRNLDVNCGYMQRIIGVAPAAGADIDYTFGIGQRYRVIGIGFNLTTAVAVANRHVTIQLVYGGGASLNEFAPVVQVASLTYTYIFNAGGTGNIIVVNGWVHGVVPVNFVVMGGAHIMTVTANLQAADQFTAPQIYVESWLETQ